MFFIFFRRENLRRRTVRRRGAASSKGFDDEIQGVPPFASCSPDTSAKIWPKFSERSKIEIVTGEHDVERGGARLASSERESKAENCSTQRRSVFERLRR